MATTQFADPEKSTDALLMCLYAQEKRPDWYREYVKAHGNPVLPWPGEKGAVELFISEFNNAFGGATREELHSVMSAKKLEGLVDDFNAHVKKDRERQEEALLIAKKHVEAIKEQVGKNGGNRDKVIDLTEEPALRQKADEWGQKPIADALSADIPADQKPIYFTKVAAASDTNPYIEEIGARLGKSAILLTALSGPAPSVVGSFGDIAVTAVQRVVAPFLNTITARAPGGRAGAINRVLVDSIQRTVDEAGEKLVKTPWFIKFQTDSHQIMTQGSSMAGGKSFIGDIAMSIFRGAPDETFLTFRELYRINAAQGLSQSKLDINKLRMARVMSMLRDAPNEVMVVYTELYRVNAAQGLPPPSLSQLHLASMGMGSPLVRTGINMGARRVGGAALSKFLAGLGVKLAMPGGGWAAAVLQIGVALLEKVGGWLKGLTGIKEGLVPGDREIIAVGCGAILLIFFALPLTNQLIIDSSLVTRLPRGGGGSQNGTQPGTTGAPGGPGTQPGGGGGGLPQYTSAPAIPSDIKGCPTKNAYVISSCITWAGHVKYGECAYDITGMVDGTPVLATHDGVVVVRSPGSKGYGNWIEIKGQTPEGETYYTIYGHLMTFNVQQDQQVRAGQTIGSIDNTGNSSGTHLHYELRSSTNAVMPDCGKQFLPAACVTNPGECNIK